MMTTVRCSQILKKCGICYTNNHCCSLSAFDNIHGKCNFSTGNILRKKSHYDVLGLSAKATQVEVKTAYYNLSKVYHPDRNEGSSDAAEKFRDITDAYEILGNYKLRRLYDKGIVHTAGAQYKDVEETVDEKDDPQTQFYKRHMKRTETPHASGRTPIYDFDAWNNHHYGKAFERSQAARKRFHEKPVNRLREENSVKYEITIFGGMALMTVILYIIMKFDERTPDAIDESTKVR